MKKFRSFICATLSFLMITSSSLTTFAYANQQKSNTLETNKSVNSTVEVYNGMGEYVGEFKSIQEFERELPIANDEKGVGAWLLTAASIYGVISMFNDASYLLTGVDLKVWVRNEVIVPYYNSRKTMKLYSVSGKTSNPYPPHSAAYNDFKRTNYYWVVQ